MTPSDPKQVDRELGLLDAARAAGVRRIVKLSVIGADLAVPISPFARWHGLVESALRASGLTYAILRPNFYMQNILRQIPAIANGSHAEPLGTARVSFIDVRDIARVAAIACSGALDGGIVTLTGPEALDGNAVAVLLSRVLGRPVAFISPDLRAFRVTAIHGGMRSWYADGLVELYASVRQGRAPHLAACTEDVQRIIGGAPRSFETFAAEAFAA